MLQDYKATVGQSLYDICLNTYGTLDNMGKLMADNGKTVAGYRPTNGEVFIWDNDQILDVSIYNLGYRYITAYNG